jgi:uncharacterized protein (TIGR02646 family)
MRLIVKGLEPDDLLRWKADNAVTPQNLTYDNMPKLPVKAQMLREQGFLCAYTMLRIETEDDCHIEHVVPRNQTAQPQYNDIAYSNLLACIPSDTPGHRPLFQPFPYGAVPKAGTLIDRNNFISPLQEDVEQRFQYAADGSVSSAPADEPARSTIEILKLNHDQLCALRKAAIDEWVLDVDLSAEEADTLSETIMDANPSGRIAEFCLAVSQVAKSLAQKLRETN